jgi:transcriptional regulator with XRE-family HTH domain
MAGRGPNPIDVVVGQNIRFQRRAKSLSQEELGERLGLTFQQIQKYEKGANRTSAGRLVQIASVLGVGVMTLFDGVDTEKARANKTLSELVRDQKAIDLLQAFASVKEAKLRAAIVEFVEQIVNSRA